MKRTFLRALLLVIAVATEAVAAPVTVTLVRWPYT